MELHTEEGTITSGMHHSYWMDTVPPIAFEPLSKDVTTDVVIVGGGISGLSVAYSLMQSGKRVVVVDDGNVGSGETGRTSAHLVTALDDRYFELERIFGEESVKHIAESHKTAIDFIERTIRYEKIDCDFQRVNGYLLLHPTDREDTLLKEMAAAKKAGIEVVELPVAPGLKEPEKCLKFYGQAQFHPMKYLAGLAAAIRERGGEIYTGTRAARIDHEGVTTGDNFRIKADHIVVATNSPVNNKFRIHLKQYPHRTYVIGAKVPKDTLPQALWWDTGDHSLSNTIPPYHYVRVQKLDNTHDLLICGGEDHPTGLTQDDRITEEDRYALLEIWMREKFDVKEIVYQWSGQVMEPMDSLAFIGRNPMDESNVYIVTGDSGNGLTHGTIAGILLSDLINGRPNQWEKIYDPSRFKIFKSGKTFFSELVGGMLSYLKNKPKHAKTTELTDIKKEEGKIIELEGKRYGAFRDSNNTMHIVGAECTHLKCTVKWNNDEKTWDCPCHGSRFTTDGKTINGPANEDLPYHAENNFNL